MRGHPLGLLGQVDVSAHWIMIGAAGREESGELRVYNQRRLEPGMEEGAACLTTFPRAIHYRG